MSNIKQTKNSIHSYHVRGKPTDVCFAVTSIKKLTIRCDAVQNDCYICPFGSTEWKDAKNKTNT